MAALVHHHVHAFAPTSSHPAVSHHACRFPSRPAPPSPPFVLVRWTPPRPGWWKLNFDGSVYHDGSGRASIGGAIRDCTGRIILAFAERTEHACIGNVEARALLRGLHLALDNGCHRLVAQSDDLTLVRLLRGAARLTRITRAMEDEIVGVLGCFFDSVEVQHVYREGNLPPICLKQEEQSARREESRRQRLIRPRANRPRRQEVDAARLEARPLLKNKKLAVG